MSVPRNYRHAGVTILDDAREVGIPDRTYQSRARREEWVHLGGGARLLPGAEPTTAARRHAALLVLGPGALLSHVTALSLHGLSSWGEPDGYGHVLVPYASTTNPPAMTRRHRSRRLEPEDATVVDGFPVTTPARTLLDVSANFGRWRIEAMMLQARQRNRLREDELMTQLERRRNVRGAARFREAQAVVCAGDVDSILEARALELVGSHGLPEPITQYRIRHRGQAVVGSGSLEPDPQGRARAGVGDLDGRARAPFRSRQQPARRPPTVIHRRRLLR